jgi:DNA-binding sugar fermentation-stimulating protein
MKAVLYFYSFVVMGVTTRSGRKVNAGLIHKPPVKMKCITISKEALKVTKRKKLILSPIEAPTNCKSTESFDNDAPLLTLSSDCVVATLVGRPSSRNRSPYVGDICLADGRIAICHLPNLDMGGKCIPGVKLLVEPMKDKKGKLIGSNAISSKYQTPKCEFSAKLLRVDEQYLNECYVPTWVGAHPSLGESLARSIIDRHISRPIPGWDKESFTSIQSQVTISDHTRADFVVNSATNDGLTHHRRIVEVKTVVDTDYCASWPVPEKAKCVFTSTREPYQRTAIFPWGQSQQVGPNGEKVVSARAIKHVKELTDVVVQSQKKSNCGSNENPITSATILFLVNRGDALRFRPNHEACPSFAEYIKAARDSGVNILAKKVRWDETQIGTCYEDDWLDIDYER